MGGYQVVLEHLDAASTAATDLAEQGSAIDVAGAVDQAPAALAGSRAEGRLHQLARTMRSRSSELTGDTRRYGDNLSRAAEYYRAHEERAKQALEGQVQQGHGPR